MPITEVNSDGNPTYQNGDPMKQVHMGHLLTMKCSINYTYLRAHSYDVDRAFLH